ncbi:Transposable element Hobo transposase [Amphibalanus amphitrite]|uniref:Transposable element Hobo transposase n=1 Tax=Amphibalanus amphitrite TaxID=1232801 RepID=A0A6A4WAC9_AMPAM|nr:Transposable element Hobo transposase [Amphibalanus amphitrite]
MKKTIPDGAKRAEKRLIAEALGDVCVEDMRPFSFVEGSGFEKAAQAFINVGAKHGKVEARDVLPGRNTIASIVSERAELARKRLRDELRTQPFLAASTDIWTEEKTSTPFSTVNVSYIREDWTLCSRVVGTKAMPESHTGVNIFRTTRQALEAVDCWKEDGEHIRYVTDNASNNKVAFQNRGRGWQSCFCHNLNLVMIQVMGSTPAVAELIDQGKRLVRFAKKTSVNSLLKSADPNGRGLKASVPTRWNSEWTMLESLRHSWPALQSLPGVADRDEVVRLLEPIDKRELDAVVDVLSFFNSASERLSASHQPTGFLVPLVLENAKRHLEPAPTDTQLGRQLKESLLQHVTGPKYGGKVGLEQYLALALHPRYRRLQQVNIDDTMRGEVERAMKQEVELAFLRRMAERPSEVASERRSTASATLPGPSSAPSTSTATPDFSLDLESMADDEEDDPEVVVDSGNARELAKAAAERECATYFLDKSGKDVKSGAELLKYWKNKASSLPCLSEVARKLHGVPASSAKAERTFSQAGRVIENRRARLHPRKVDDLLLATDNADLLK